jgi:hypothetical protein
LNPSVAKFRSLMPKLLPSFIRSSLGRDDEDDILRAVVHKLPRRSCSKSLLYDLSRDKNIVKLCPTFSAPGLAKRLYRLARMRKVHNICTSVPLNEVSVFLAFERVQSSNILLQPLPYDGTATSPSRRSDTALDLVKQHVPIFLHAAADSLLSPFPSSNALLQPMKDKDQPQEKWLREPFVRESNRHRTPVHSLQGSPYGLAKEARSAANLERHKHEVAMKVDDHQMAFDPPAADFIPLATPATSKVQIPVLNLLSLSSYTDDLPDYELVVDQEMAHTEVLVVATENMDTSPVPIHNEFQNVNAPESIFPQQVVDKELEDWRNQFIDMAASTSSESHLVQNAVADPNPLLTYATVPTLQLLAPGIVSSANPLSDMTNLISAITSSERHRDFSQAQHHRRRRANKENSDPTRSWSTSTSVLDQGDGDYSKHSNPSRSIFSPYSRGARNRYLQKSGAEVTPSARMEFRRIEKMVQKFKGLTDEVVPREEDRNGNDITYVNGGETYGQDLSSPDEEPGLSNGDHGGEGEVEAANDQELNDNPEVDASLEPEPKPQFNADSPEVWAILMDAKESALSTAAVNDLADLFANLSRPAESSGGGDLAEVISSEKNSDDAGQQSNKARQSESDNKGDTEASSTTGSNSAS